MNPYSSLCDDFYVNMNLSTEMELPNNRETILHYFERIQKTYPTMRNFYCREKGDFVLEEDKDGGQYRWCTVESRRLCSGQVNPRSIDEVLAQHKLVLELAPYMLSVSPLDCEALDLLFGFDFTYRGNQNQLVVDALGLSPAFERFGDISGTTPINYEPSITMATDDDCRMQCGLASKPAPTPIRSAWANIPKSKSASTSPLGNTAAWGRASRMSRPWPSWARFARKWSTST